MTTLLIGTYPAAGAGTPAGLGEGIWRVDLDGTGAFGEPSQVAATPAPSFLCTGPAEGVVYAANECTDGAVTAWRWAGDVLVPHGATSTGGADPCHIRYVEALRAIVATNYSSGSVAVIRVSPDGSLPDAAPAQVVALHGSGPDAARQEGPHAHQSVPSPDGRFLLVNDLGSDTVWRFSVGDGGLALDGAAAVLPAGTGPRHGAFSADGSLYLVAGELDDTVHVLGWDAHGGTLAPLGTLPADPSGSAVVSHVEVVGDVLTVACRGTDAVTRFAVRGDGALPLPAFPLPAGGFARHHLTQGERIVVALQRGHEIVVLGPEGAVVSRARIPSPACVLEASSTT
ncbi:MAG: beta-propeller fold lactonase family protein [Arachnia sp.]